MLKVERLETTDGYHRHNYWEALPVSYPNSRYKLLKNRLARETKETRVAHRILLNNLYVLTTLKLGHDGYLFVQDNPQYISMLPKP